MNSLYIKIRLYLILFIFPLLGLCLISVISSYIAKYCFVLYRNKVSYHYLDWVYLFPYYNAKLYDLVLFITFFTLSFLFIILYIVILNLFKKTPIDFQDNLLNLKLLLPSLLSRNICERYNVFCSQKYIKTTISLFHNKYLSFNNICILIIILLSSLFFCDISPFIKGDVKVFNEYIDFSETVFVQNKSLDSIRYIKNNLLYPRYKDIDEFLSDNSSQSTIQNNPNIVNWMKEIESNRTNEEFIAKSLYEYQYQTSYSSYELIQFQTINPINMWMKGVPYNKTGGLYGYATLGAMKTYFDIVGFNFKKWFNLIYSIYPLYIFGLAIAALLYFRSLLVGTFVLITTLLFTFYNVPLGYFIIVTGQMPVNPIRHLFEIPIIIFIGLYIDNKKYYNLLLINFVSAIAVWSSPNFGLILALSVNCTLLFVILADKNYKHLLLLTLTGISVLISFLFIPNVDHGGIKYFLDGHFGNPIPTKFSMIIFVVYSMFALLLMLVSVVGQKNKVFYLSLFLTPYTYLMLYHFIWHGDLHSLIHFWPTFCLLVLSSIIMIKGLFITDKYNNHVTLILILCCLIYFIQSYKAFNKTKSDYLDTFKNHQLYEWNFGAVNYTTTGSPRYLENAVHLIHKYSKEEDGIYLISRYDFILPVVSNTYSKMFYPCLQWWLFLPDDKINVYKDLMQAKPGIIYIDSDILLNDQLWTVNNYMSIKYTHFNKDNKTRLSRLKELRDIYFMIAPYYELIEKGDIISVYKRKNISNVTSASTLQN